MARSSPFSDEYASFCSRGSVKQHFRVPAEDGSAPLRLKIEINTRETEACDAPQDIPYAVENPWFAGQTKVATYSREEMLATKLRALMQRNKGRDLFDLSHALVVFEGLDTACVIAYFQNYLQRAELNISRAEAERRMFEKLRNPHFLADMRPLLPPAAADALTDEVASRAFSDVFTGLVIRLPGEPWARTAEMSQRFGLVLNGSQ